MDEETLDIIEKLKDYNRVVKKNHFITLFPDYSGEVICVRNGVDEGKFLFFSLQELREKMYREILKKNDKSIQD